jgi:tripartite-type tricarboxylate transporter receptor subunit TctC
MAVTFFRYLLVAGLVNLGLLGEGLAAEPYAGKTINIVVGVGPGGGLDAYARLFARHFGQNIPGNPAIVVQNKPGASSLTAVQSLDVLPKDGTTIVSFNPSLLLPSVLTPDKVKADFSQFNWLGSVAKQPRVCLMWGATGIETFDDMMKKNPVIMGGSGGGETSIELKILTNLFGMKLKQVDGYNGSSETRLAVERGEIDGDCTSWSSIPEDWIRDKKINFTVRFQEGDRRGQAEHVPYVGDLTKDADQKKLVAMLGAPAELGRPFILSKDVPADRMLILRDAFDKTVKDPQFLSDADKAQLEISPARGVEADGLLKAITGAPAPVVASAKKLMGE